MEMLLCLQSDSLISYIKKHKVQGHTLILNKKVNLNKHRNFSELTHPLNYIIREKQQDFI